MPILFAIHSSTDFCFFRGAELSVQEKKGEATDRMTAFLSFLVIPASSVFAAAHHMISCECSLSLASIVSLQNKKKLRTPKEGGKSKARVTDAKNGVKRRGKEPKEGEEGKGLNVG